MTVIQSSAWRSENSFPAGAGRAATDLVLVAFYVFQALLAGLALWQGNRVFYPGQVAWTPLVR